MYHLIKTSEGFPGGSDGKESACNAEDLGLIPELGRSPGEGNSDPLQQMTSPYGRKQRGNKDPLDESERGE